jgi:hypothetical protein
MAQRGVKLKLYTMQRARKKQIEVDDEDLWVMIRMMIGTR